MAQVIFHPEAGVSDETSQFGYAFAGGNPVAVTNEKHLAKFRGNPFFEVVEDGADIAHAPAPAVSDAAPDEGTEGQADANAPVFKAVHRGRGSYSVMNGETEVMEGLSKADAEVFNALSPEDQAAYVAPANT